MFKTRVLASALALGAIAAASVFAAAPASAATLPSGQQITVVEYGEWQFAEANPETAVLTTVGTGEDIIPIDTYVTAADVADDGLGYALTTTYEEIVPEPCDPEDIECIPAPPFDEPQGSTLYTADANTGVLDGGIDVQIVTGPLDEPVLADADECLALDYSAGALLAACQIYGEDDSAWIGTLDPATAILTPSVLLVGAEEFVQFQAIALDPITGTLWGFDDDYMASFTIDPTAPINPVVLVAYTDMTAYAADFDRGGQLWVSAYRLPPVPTADIGENENGLATLDPETGTFPFNEAWENPDLVFDALTVWGEPALAETGATQSPAVAIGATALMLFGAILAAGAVAIRRRSVES